LVGDGSVVDTNGSTGAGIAGRARASISTVEQ
jgi:hypothetical protein